MTDDEFLTETSARLARLPTVQAVALGGSRATGTHRPDSDWDLAIYYHGQFDPDALRQIGWPGHVSEVGGWGGGVFNGGAWLQIDGRRVDVHYRDLDVVHHQLDEARAGRFAIEPLLFHLAGIPTYLVVAELAVNQVRHGTLPRPGYPAALRARAPAVWWRNADLVLGYADDNYAPRAQLAPCVALITQAALMSAHAVLAARGEWVTNEKTLLHRAGLDDLDAIIGEARASSALLHAAVREARCHCSARLQAAQAAHRSLRSGQAEPA